MNNGGIDLKNKRFDGWTLIIALVLCMAFISYFTGDFTTTKTKELTYSELLMDMDSGKVKSVTTYENGQAHVELVDDNTEYIVALPSKEAFIEKYDALYEEGKGFVYKDVLPMETPWWISLMPTIAIVVIFILFWVFFLNQAGGGGGKVMSFGKSRAKLNDGKGK